MKRFREWVFIVGLTSVFSTFGAEALNSQAPASTNLVGADALWAGMHEQGMISDEQYRFVQETGHLPGGTTVSNSPVAAESQGNWNLLAKEEVITPDELAAMLFDGDIPGLTEEEEQAFIELAPVYQPKRSKRLTYDVRSKHARVELIRLGHQLRKEREALEKRARLLDIPLVVGETALSHIDEEGRPHYMGSLGMESCDSISTDEVWGTNRVNAAGVLNTNFNLTGAGITLAMWEFAGINETHQEFVGRATDYAGGSLKHANAVAAVMAGAGISNNANGTAYEASLHVYSWNDDDPLGDLTDVANEGVIRFSNHSYWTPFNDYGEYTGKDEKRDEIVYDAYYHLPVWAVGNVRTTNDYYVSLNAGSAKNVLSVGAVEELQGGYTTTSNVLMTYYSSWGPTLNGRIKPDLVASGFSGLIPVRSSNAEYENEGLNGTSFAAPAVTGSLGLLQELHERLSGSNSVPLLASTYKGLAIHTADEAGEAPGPDYKFGWGLMNTLSAVQLMTENAKWNSSPFIKEFVLPDGDYACFPVEADTNLPLRVTVCWSDPPGEELINDIDLRIIDPSGQTNFPWVLNPTNGFRGFPATRGDNTRDNVEQVEVTNTVEGAYTVLIYHKGTLVNAEQQPDGQELSVILSGLIPENIDPEVALSFTTNGFARLEISGALGPVYELSHTYNLPYVSWTEVPESPLSVLHMQQTEWLDPGASTNAVRFYKMEETE